MSLTAHLKSTGLLLICFVITISAISLPTASAQSPCVTCTSQQSYVPMYLQFGVDPYNQRQIGYMPITPLQTNLYQRPSVSRCLPCGTYAIDSSHVVVQGNVIVSADPAVAPTVDGTVALPDANDTPKAPEPESTADSENTISSPSDIVLSKKKTMEPTLADDASSKNMAQLDEARKQIARLKEEISAGKEQARVAMERAYAAEKTASATKVNAEKSQQQLMDEKARLLQAANDATAQLKKSQQTVDKLFVELRAAEKLAENSSAKAQAKSAKETSGAEKRVAKLNADAKQAAQAKRKKNNQPKKKAPNPPTNRISDQPKKKQTNDSKKKKPSNAPAEQQIKNLEESMVRQIKNTSARIRKRNQSAIKKLTDSGKKDSDPAVQKLKEKMATELKNNEAKIRKRVQERINRIRKEAGKAND